MNSKNRNFYGSFFLKSCLFSFLLFNFTSLFCLAPTSIKNKNLAFYVEEDDLKKKQEDVLEGVWFFRKNGTYQSHLRNKTYMGDYSYHILKDKNRVQLVITYPDESGTDLFHVELLFDTPETGKWQWLQKAKPRLSRYQRGHFKVVDDQEARQLVNSLSSL